MKQTEQLKRELELLQEVQQLRLDNNILRMQRDEWRSAARRRENNQ